MKYMAWALALCIYLPLATWLFYLAGMAFDRAKHEGGNDPAAEAIVRYVLGPLASLHNAAHNALPMSILFLDLPREFATTKRLNRYVDGSPGWRRDLALQMRERLLNRYDRRGVHT
jgi:hypothetical protein